MPKTFEVEPEKVLVRDRFGNPQLRPMRRDSWSVKDRARFLDHLAATCNVKASAEAVGRYPATAYTLRRRDADFAELWDRALETGYAALETMMVDRARRRIGIPIGENENTPAPDDTGDELALRLLNAYRSRMVGGKMRRGGQAFRKATEQETDAAIIKRLKILHRRLSKNEGDGA